MEPIPDRHRGASLSRVEGQSDRVVQFYEGERFLCDRAGAFLADGLRDGATVLVIATNTHRHAFLRLLKSRYGVDVPRASAAGRLTCLDARDTLQRVMRGGMPDPVLVHQHLGAAISEALTASGGKPLRAYGEMVDLLWRDLNARAALRLEEIWTELAGTHRFVRLCAYDISRFCKPSDGGDLPDLCDRFTQAIPAESYSEAATETDRHRAVVELQQRASALQIEVAQRKALERALKLALAGRRTLERERADLEKEGRAARAELRRVVEERDRLRQSIDGLAHDVRTPLSTIRGWAQMASLRPPDPAALPRVFEVIDRNADAVNRLIEALLQANRALAASAP